MQPTLHTRGEGKGLRGARNDRRGLQLQSGQSTRRKLTQYCHGIRWLIWPDETGSRILPCAGLGCILDKKSCIVAPIVRERANIAEKKRSCCCLNVGDYAWGWSIDFGSCSWLAWLTAWERNTKEMLTLVTSQILTGFRRCTFSSSFAWQIVVLAINVFQRWPSSKWKFFYKIVELGCAVQKSCACTQRQ